MEPKDFTGRIDRRLSLVFGALFALVLAVGGISLYLLGSVLYKSEDIARQSEEVHLLERIHRRLHDFFFAMQLGEGRRATIALNESHSYVENLQSLLALYRKAGARDEDVRELREIIASSAAVAARVGVDAPAGGDSDKRVLTELEVLQQRLRALTDRITSDHEIIEEQHVPKTNRKMRITIAFNIAFVLLGTAFLLAAQRYFQRAIAAPLRQLTDGARDIAKGDVPKTVPVTSNDEMGLLSRSFNQMASQLKSNEEALRGLAILQERERLARELHDSLAQDLAFLRLKLIEAEQVLNLSASPEAKRAVKEILEAIDVAYQELRQAIFGLRTLDSKQKGGLIAVLREFLRDFSALRHIPLELKPAEPEWIALPPEVETQLIRIIHEALTNIVKHANASKGTLTIEHDQVSARITIADDGRGFPVDRAAEGRFHFGLHTMRERAESVGGKLSIRSEPEKGTAVVIELPLVQELPDGNNSNTFS